MLVSETVMDVKTHKNTFSILKHINYNTAQKIKCIHGVVN